MLRASVLAECVSCYLLAKQEWSSLRVLIRSCRECRNSWKQFCKNNKALKLFMGRFPADTIFVRNKEGTRCIPCFNSQFTCGLSRKGSDWFLHQISASRSLSVPFSIFWDEDRRYDIALSECNVTYIAGIQRVGNKTELTVSIRSSTISEELGRCVIPCPNNVEDCSVCPLPGNYPLGIPPDDSALGTLHDDSALGTLPDDSALGTLSDDSALGTLSDDSALGTLPDDSALGTLPSGCFVYTMQTTYGGPLEMTFKIFRIWLWGGKWLVQYVKTVKVGGFPANTAYSGGCGFRCYAFPGTGSNAATSSGAGPGSNQGTPPTACSSSNAATSSTATPDSGSDDVEHRFVFNIWKNSAGTHSIVVRVPKTTENPVMVNMSEEDNPMLFQSEERNAELLFDQRTGKMILLYHGLYQTSPSSPKRVHNVHFKDYKHTRLWNGVLGTSAPGGIKVRGLDGVHYKPDGEPW